MANNQYGTSDRAIFLEFEHTIGSDAIYYVDGRHNDQTVERLIIERVNRIKKWKNYEFLGFSLAGDYSRKIYRFPEHVYREVNR